MRDNPLNPHKRDLKWTKLGVSVCLAHPLLDADFDAGVQLADAELRNRFESTLSQWEGVTAHGPGIIYSDSESGVKDVGSHIEVRTDVNIDLEALDANARSIGGYVEEASAKFKLIMDVYKTGLSHGKRKARRSISDYAVAK